MQNANTEVPASQLYRAEPIVEAIRWLASHFQHQQEINPGGELAQVLKRLLDRLLTAAHQATNLQCYVCAKTAGEVWEKSPSQVRSVCRQGKIRGAIKVGGDWRIPATALDEPFPV